MSGEKGAAPAAKEFALTVRLIWPLAFEHEFGRLRHDLAVNKSLAGKQSRFSKMIVAFRTTDQIQRGGTPARSVPPAVKTSDATHAWQAAVFAHPARGRLVRRYQRGRSTKKWPQPFPVRVPYVKRG